MYESIINTVIFSTTTIFISQGNIQIIQNKCRPIFDGRLQGRPKPIYAGRLQLCTKYYRQLKRKENVLYSVPAAGCVAAQLACLLARCTGRITTVSCDNKVCLLYTSDAADE